MAKDPAFPFYSNDFDAKTKFFTHEQVGMYIRLLIAQHQAGHLTEQQMVFVCGRKDKDVFGKFSKDANGSYYNERLEDELTKRKAYSESRRANISKRYVTTHEATYVEGMKAHMDNDNENKCIYSLTKCEELFFADFEIHRMVFQENQFTQEQLEQAKTEFWNAKKLSEETTTKPYSDIKKHFLNWSRTNKERIKKQNNGQNKSDKKVGRISTSAAARFLSGKDSDSE